MRSPSADAVRQWISAGRRLRAHVLLLPQWRLHPSIRARLGSAVISGSVTRADGRLRVRRYLTLHRRPGESATHHRRRPHGHHHCTSSGTSSSTSSGTSFSTSSGTSSGTNSSTKSVRTQEQQRSFRPHHQCSVTSPAMPSGDVTSDAQSRGMRCRTAERRRRIMEHLYSAIAGAQLSAMVL